jgi:hypothetical protein
MDACGCVGAFARLWDTFETSRRLRHRHGTQFRHRFESRTARLKLAIRKKPYSGPALGNGITLLYRRNTGNGTWVVKAPNGKGGYWTKRIADADDYADASGSTVLIYFAAPGLGSPRPPWATPVAPGTNSRRAISLRTGSQREPCPPRCPFRD